MFFRKSLRESERVAPFHPHRLPSFDVFCPACRLSVSVAGCKFVFAVAVVHNPAICISVSKITAMIAFSI